MNALEHRGHHVDERGGVFSVREHEDAHQSALQARAAIDRCLTRRLVDCKAVTA